MVRKNQGRSTRELKKFLKQSKPIRRLEYKLIKSYTCTSAKRIHICHAWDSLGTTNTELIQRTAVIHPYVQAQ